MEEQISGNYQKYLTYPQLLKEIMDNGNIVYARGLKTKELTNVLLVADNFQNLFYAKRARPLEKVKEYLLGELYWYFSGDRKVDFIKQYSIFWSNLVDKKNELNSNYGNIVFYKKHTGGQSMYQWCLKSLRRDPYGRQAVILYNDPLLYREKNKDFVCTQLQHFLIRNHRLDTIIYMRSSDAILGLTYDIPWWSVVTQYLYWNLYRTYSNQWPCAHCKERTALGLGKIYVHIGSSHIYDNKFKLVKSMLEEGISTARVNLMSPPPLYRNNTEWYKKNLSKYIEILD